VHHQNGLEITFQDHNPFGLQRNHVIALGLRTASSFGIIMSVLGGMTLGFTTVLMPDHHQMRDIHHFLQQNSITHAMFTPRMIQFMLAHVDCLPREFQQVWATGDSLPLTLAEQFQNKFHHTVYDSYGFGECRAWCMIANGPQHHRRGSLGKIAGGVQHKILDANGDPVTTDCVGELWISHPNLAMGYHNDPVRTRKHFDQGWYRTGDFVSQDSDGYVYYAGRSTNLIETSRGWVSCIEIENRLCQQPGVTDCVVVSDSGILHGFVLGQIRTDAALTLGLDSVSMVSDIPFTETHKKIRHLDRLQSYVIES
jgi:acyl-coenzyme A synthetase/AMP-(fatty) acid ligase